MKTYIFGGRFEERFKGRLEKIEERRGPIICLFWLLSKGSLLLAFVINVQKPITNTTINIAFAGDRIIVADMIIKK